MKTVDRTPATESPFSICPDAQVLLRFQSEVGDLITALEDLDRQADGMQDLSPSKARDVMMFSAGQLQKRITDVRDALLRHDLLTKGRETVLVELGRAIDHLENILRTRLSTDWVFRRSIDHALEEGLDEWISERLEERVASESLPIADRALEAIKNASPGWITSKKIGELIGVSDKAVRSALSRWKRKYEGSPLIESDASGKHLGYRWIAE